MLISCPACKNRTTWEENPWRPFCSERCKCSDLGRWASEDFKIPCENDGDNIDTETAFGEDK